MEIDLKQHEISEDDEELKELLHQKTKRK